MSSANGGPVENYLVWAILATVFCCMPFGVVAIVYAAQVDGKLAAGDYIGAVTCSQSAELWTKVSFYTGLCITLGYLFLFFLGIACD